MAQFTEKTVWLIGAGASISDTNGHFPALVDIPERARNLGLLAPEKDSDGALRPLGRFLRTKYYGDITAPGTRIDLESVLTLLEIDIAVRPAPRLLLVRDFILLLLRRTIGRLHREPFTQAGEYDSLVKRLSAQDSIISFNWDLLLDNALGRDQRLRIPDGTDSPRLYDEPNLYSQFLLDFTGWGERTIKRLSSAPPTYAPESKGRFIKAHGSIDWFYCADKTCAGFGPIYPMLSGPKNQRPFCPVCLARTSVLIVPPTLNKQLRELPALRRLWAAAANELQAATCVVVWGYSMPPTDFFSEWLLRHARSRRCKKMIVINPACVAMVRGKVELRSAFVDRFVSALRLPGKSILLELYESFADFETGTHVGEKYPHLAKALLRAARRRRTSIA